MSAAFDELYGLLVPLAGGRLVMPRAAIVEVMGYTAPRERPDGVPDWFLGWINWQGRRIPLISFEVLCGQPMPEFKQRTRIAVTQAILGLLDPPAFAIATQGYPYLLRVNRGVLKLDDSGDAIPEPVLARVRMANERPAVPDLELLERMLATALGIEEQTPATEAVEVMPDEPTQLGGTEVRIAEDGDSLLIDDDIDAASLEAALEDIGVDTEPALGIPAPRRGEVGDGLVETTPSSGADEDALFDDLSIEGIEVDEGDATE